MKQLILIFFLLPVFCMGQNIRIDYPLESITFIWYHFENQTYLKSDTINEIRIETERCPNRYIVAAIDPKNATIESHWTPIQKSKKWNDPLAEYTMMTAERLGGVNNKASSDRYHYNNNDTLYWQKTFILTPYQNDSLEISVYCDILDDLNYLGLLKIEIKN